MNIASGLRILVVASCAALIGCGPSQADLDHAKEQNRVLRTERDSMKSQLDLAEGKITSLQQQVTTCENAAKEKADAAAEKDAAKPAGKASKKTKKSRKKKH